MKVKYHFFGKDCIIDRDLFNRSHLNSRLIQEGFKYDNLLFVNQVHGREVVIVDEVEKIYGTRNLPKADALVTNLPNVVIGIITADCAPVLFYDEAENIVAIAHAGWRGAKAGIINSTIAAMRNLGAKNISAIIGPMIQQDSYQVSQEFYDDFLAEKISNAVFFIEDGEGKYKFDLPSYVEEKLELEGIRKIVNSRIDTYKNEEHLFSFRRSTHKGEVDCGRNVSVIGIG